MCLIDCKITKKNAIYSLFYIFFVTLQSNFNNTYIHEESMINGISRYSTRIVSGIT